MGIDLPPPYTRAMALCRFFFNANVAVQNVKRGSVDLRVWQKHSLDEVILLLNALDNPETEPQYQTKIDLQLFGDKILDWAHESGSTISELLEATRCARKAKRFDESSNISEFLRIAGAGFHSIGTEVLS